MPSAPDASPSVLVDLLIQAMLITTFQGSALIVLDQRERSVLIDTIALVLATTESHSEVALPVGMEPMLRLMVRGLLNGRGRAGQAAPGGD